MKNRKTCWGLLRSAQYREEFERLPSKFRSQVARKTFELMSDPRPGGSRVTLKGYDKLCRLRVGDFRVIYAYDDNAIELLTLRRRDERTYDHLDELETRQLASFRNINRISEPHAGNALQPPIEDISFAATRSEPLPRPITAQMLDQLDIPEPFRPGLLRLRTGDELLECQEVPYQIIERILECICPKNPDIAPEPPLIVRSVHDLVDARAAQATGPIDASGDADMSRIGPEAAVSAKALGSAAQVPATAEPPLVSIVRRQEPMTPYKGNTARAIAKDTRYTVKLNGKVALLYYVDERETALLTTDDHPELVGIVNAAKRAGGNTQDGGSFVVNEYRHVLVPNAAGERVLFAGVYTRDLEFRFEGSLISPIAPSTIRPGDIWPGPHVGIRYTLAAGASDIRYEETTARGTQRRICLSDFHSKTALEPLLQMCRRLKSAGGAIYINEARELFAPVEDAGSYERRYIGHLGTLPWFPEPAV
jgi:mRNA-degrading endonuclease RelE of RelBE toxin-antitoxin system